MPQHNISNENEKFFSFSKAFDLCATYSTNREKKNKIFRKIPKNWLKFIGEYFILATHFCFLYIVHGIEGLKKHHGTVHDMRSGSFLILAICSRNVLLLFLSLFISFYSSSFIQKSLFAVIRVHLQKMCSLLAEQHVFMKKCINYFKFECNHKSLLAIARKNL